MDAPTEAALSHTLATFAGLVGSRFRIGVDAATPMEVELIEARGLSAGHATAARREAFSLIFLGPPVSLLPQRRYGFEHDELGSLEIFIVPIGRDDRGVRYEAIFS